MNTLKINRYTSGFALPTVLIASVVMLAVLASSVAAVTATRLAIQGQYYDQLARDAAESGLEMAKACIAAGTTTWANPLRPGGDCNGLASACTSNSCYVVKTTEIRSSFAVASPTVAGDITTVEVTGSLEQTRLSSGTVWRTYNQTIRQKAIGTTGTGTATVEVGAFIAVATGTNHTCALDPDGKAYCWGYNSTGRLGDNTTTQRNMPTAVTMPSGITFTKLGLGNGHSCALGSDNKAYCWGSNSNGQVGDSTTSQRTVPTLVTMPGGITFTKITAGNDHSCALGSDGKAYCWGNNFYGQLGDSTNTLRTVPTQVTMPVGITFTQIAAGTNHTCALGSDNNAYCWGDNTYGKLGDTTTTQRTAPTLATMPSGVTFTQITSGVDHSCALGSDGKAYCWGRNTSGQLGDSTGTQRTAPTLATMPSGVTFTQITSGNGHTCAVGSNGNGYCWGDNTFGKLGDNTQTQRSAPTLVSMPSGVTFALMAGGSGHSCALGANYQAYCWGDNSNGQLGDDASSTWRTVPARVVVFRFTQLAAGNDHTCGLGSDKNVYCWGSNATGQLGDGTTVSKSVPVIVTMPSGISFTQVASGTGYSCALGSDSKAYCWGTNVNGRLGDGTTTQRTIPTLATMPSGITFTKLTAGSAFACAIGSDGKAYCWGAGGYIGDGTSTQRTVPTLATMPVGVTFTQIASGSVHTCALGSNSKAYCWGTNTNGQLGDGTTTARTVPTITVRGAIASNKFTLSYITVGATHSCTVALDNLLYCWGLNTNGQLGNNTVTQNTSPVLVTLPSGVTSFTGAVGGGSHTCAVGSNSSTYCWGLNTSGQLGDTTSTQRNVPTLVSPPSGYINLTNLSLGSAHTCAIGANYITYCWGNNGNGRLGDNTTTNRSSPTPVVFPQTVITISAPSTSRLYYF